MIKSTLDARPLHALVGLHVRENGLPRFRPGFPSDAYLPWHSAVESNLRRPQALRATLLCLALQTTRTRTARLPPRTANSRRRHASADVARQSCPNYRVTPALDRALHCH